MIGKFVKMLRAVVPIAFLFVSLMAMTACQNTGAAGLLPGSVQNGDTQDEIVAATSFLERDLTEAKASADAWGDRSASQCWGVLLDHVKALPGKTESKVVGLAGAYQRARNGRRIYDAGMPEDIHIACAPMVSDAKSTLFRLAKLAGGIGLP
jgi:hypothetical protein